MKSFISENKKEKLLDTLKVIGFLTCLAAFISTVYLICTFLINSYFKFNYVEQVQDCFENPDSYQQNSCIREVFKIDMADYCYDNTDTPEDFKVCYESRR